MSVAATAQQSVKDTLQTAFQPVAFYLQRPIRLFREYDTDNFRPDLVAGLTVAVILLPQAIAFTLIAELPPEMGLYAAIMGGLAGALWGSSDQMHTGPANAISLLVLSTLAATAVPGSAAYVVAAGLMTLMVGVLQLVMGLARLGILVNFVSHSVIVGFASGAAVLIGVKQLEPLLGLSLPRSDILHTVVGVASNVPAAHIPSVVLGVGTIVLILVLNRVNPKLPGALISMVVASVVVAILGPETLGVATIGQLPSGFPPIAELPVFDLDLIAQLSTGALAVGAIGLVEAAAIARSISSQTGQRLDSNQEFVGQGMSNLFAGLFTGYAVAGSFSRSAVNVSSGARTPMAAIISCVFVLLATLTLGSFTRFLPQTALAGLLILTAIRMIDREEMARIMRGARGDAVIMIVTFLGTLFLSIEFAVLAGILLSFALYIIRTSMPRVQAVVPDDAFRHFLYQPDKPECPQLGIVEILGDLYFGAVNHVEEFILEHAANHPEQRFLIMRMHNVNHCDFSGIHMLETVVRAYRDDGGDVFMVRVSHRVREIMKATGFEEFLGQDHFVDEDQVISRVFHHVLDPAVCIYECPVRVFKECQNLPKQVDVVDIPRLSDVPQGKISYVSAQQLWQQLRNGQTQRPQVVDVRERREYRRGHIAEAESVPLPKLMDPQVKFQTERPIVMVCQSGRRSRRAAYALQRIGCNNVYVLEGGMQAWEAADLLSAVEYDYGNGEEQNNRQRVEVTRKREEQLLDK